jgi:hypothetical protein
MLRTAQIYLVYMRSNVRAPCLNQSCLITKSFAVLIFFCAACGSDDSDANLAVNIAGASASASGSAGTSAISAGNSSAIGAGFAGASAGNGTAGTRSSAAGTGVAGTSAGNPVAGTSAAPAGAAGAMVPAAMSGSAGAPGTAPHDYCVSGEPADARDAQLTGMPDQWKSPSGAIDLVVPKLVLDWMSERIWEPSHDAWHNVRRCRSGVVAPGAGRGTTSLCSRAELIPAHQECADAEDGYQFLVVHRHMLQALKHAFPQHSALFDGFPHFPFEASAVPVEWQARWGTGWSAKIKETATTLEDIENQLSQFPTEGDLGRFIQCGGMASGASSIHGALHFKWVVNDSPYSLGKQTVNIDNHMFWKLHGWIDTIWERYRAAKGLAPTEPKLQQALIDQCTEMHTLGHAVKPDAGTPAQPLPVEHGEFHEKVRPILEKTCGSCHSEASPEAAMSLGGQISSADVVTGLVNVQSMHGGQFKRVVAGDANQSWLYLKAAGMAMTAGCTGAMCNTQVMPPTGQVTLTQTELDTIRQWIANGAPMPTQ